ncbi:MAG: YaiI/YqxD family protein [Actinobacteria bacterium HGW-Actinobacteria-7]|jgi:hypothetical protein|nr:MAG: YaiI/YqxD family protein [Actinobacteria bacterium HGW-Actinobacteria-7]
MTKIFIDADACPVTREVISIARARGIDVILVANGSFNFGRYTGRKGVEGVLVSSGADAADFAIIERLSPGDIVVTQDIGLAAMVLGRGARAIGVRGRLYTLATIDIEMEVRHAEKNVRRRGGRTGGPAPFDEDDRERFSANLERLIAEG